MRTTLDLELTILEELRRRSRGEGKSMGQVASELLATELARTDRPTRSHEFSWNSADLGAPYVDLEDDEAVRAVLDGQS